MVRDNSTWLLLALYICIHFAGLVCGIYAIAANAAARSTAFWTTVIQEAVIAAGPTPSSRG